MTFFAGIEDQHEVQRDHQVAGGDQVERAHVPARGHGLHHLGVPGQQPLKGGPHQEDQFRGYCQQQTDDGVSPGNWTIVSQF